MLAASSQSGYFQGSVKLRCIFLSPHPVSEPMEFKPLLMYLLVSPWVNLCIFTSLYIFFHFLFHFYHLLLLYF